MTILIEDKEALLKKGSSFDFISENRLFTGSDSYTLSMTFPLADCPQNRAIFGNIERKDVVKDKVLYDCAIIHGSMYRSGVVTITEISEKEVKTQFLEGRSAQNFESTFDNTYINEFEWGQYITGLAKNYPPADTWRIYDTSYPNSVSLPWVNSYSGNIQNEARWDSDHGNYTWVFRNGNGRNKMKLSQQPFLIYAVEEILYNVGYTADLSEWRGTEQRFILICNTLPAAWDVPSFARAMPHWSITEFLHQIELLLNAEFDIDHKQKKVTFHYISSILHDLYDEVIDTVIDEYKVDISSEANDKFLPAAKRLFADCDHNAWKYYSSPWVLRTLWDKIRTYNTMSDFLNACSEADTIIMQYGDSEEQSENTTIINSIHYVKDVDTYFAFRNTKVTTREGPLVVDGEEISSGTYVYSRSYAPVPVNIFGDRSITGSEEEKIEELKMVPAWLDETDDEHGFMLFLQMNNYDETAEDDLAEEDASKLVNPMPLAIIAQGEEQGVPEYYDKIYLAYWDGNLPQQKVPMPWVDTIMIDAKWQYLTFPTSLRFDGRTAINYNTYNVDLKKKYTFSFLSDEIPNPRAVFHINGLRYICEKITATLTENGMSRKMKGVFYRLIS